MDPWNTTQLTDTSVCNGGISCLLRNINEVGNGYPFLTVFIMAYIISTLVLLKKGNHFLKSFTASTFLMFILSLISVPFDFINQKLLLTILILLAITSAINVYLMRKY